MPSETCTETVEITQEGAPPLWAGGRGDLGALQVLNSSYFKSLGRDGPQLLALGQFYRRLSLFPQAPDAVPQWLRDLRPFSMRRRMTCTPVGVLSRRIQPCLCLRLMLLGWYSFPRVRPRVCCCTQGSPQASGSPIQTRGWSHLPPNWATDLQAGHPKVLARKAMSSGG